MVAWRLAVLQGPELDLAGVGERGLAEEGMTSHDVHHVDASRALVAAGRRHRPDGLHDVHGDPLQLGADEHDALGAEILDAEPVRRCRIIGEAWSCIEAECGDHRGEGLHDRTPSSESCREASWPPSYFMHTEVTFASGPTFSDAH